MRRARVAVLLAAAAATFGTACTPPGPTPTNNPPPPPAPTAAVGSDGQPITNLCDLLSSQDFTSIAGATANTPDTSKATDKSATCEYGKNVRLVVSVNSNDDEASQAFAQASRKFTGGESGTMAGVDESVSGSAGGQMGLVVRRRLLVFTIEIPGSTAEGKFKLIQLSGRLLERAHALGT
jgi:hypothetical protein